MIPEIGHFSLILALVLAFFMVFACALALKKDSSVPPPAVSIKVLAQRMGIAMTLLILTSFGLLLYSFWQVDLSVTTVYQHAHHTLPWYYRLTAVWGGHEGSLLLWLSILSLWGLVFFMTTDYTNRYFLISRAALAFIFFGLLLFTLFTSNPFERYLPVTPLQGLDLNPLLQDPGMILHPPLLYVGYVGFALPFVMAVAVLWQGDFPATVMRLMRKYILFAWAFLTLGITLGSFWAYYELGWGGWWFWDPVENASLLPWLSGCALMHSINVSNNRKLFYGWTLLLCIITFGLSLLGTFLVRSGVLTSVHSFANDPERGLFILILLALYTLPVLTLYAVRVRKLIKTQTFHLTSREGLILFNNVLFIVMTGTVLLGTIYPLIIEGLGLGFISVGAPYFNKVLVPMGLLLAWLLGLSPLSTWAKPYALPIKIIVGFIVLSVSALVLFLMFEFPLLVVMVIILALWVLTYTVVDTISKKNKRNLSYWGMHVAHLGVVVALLGITMSSHYKIERDVSMTIGDTVPIHDYEFKLLSLHNAKGSNYTGEKAVFDVTYQNKSLPLMKPEKRYYMPRDIVLSETAIQSHRQRDLYIALSEPLGEKSWAVRIHYKPFVRWVWFGGIMIALGALMSWVDRKYLSARFVDEKA